MGKRIAIIGCGPSGAICGIVASENPKNHITFFEAKSPLSTLLPTGGGRCNLAFEEYNPQTLATYYPRGEKFLYSVFSKFSTQDTLSFFDSIGIKTYTQDDLRIFPVSNSASDVRKKILQRLRQKNIEIKNERLNKVEYNGKSFILNGLYEFDTLVISTGGKCNGCELAKALGHTASPATQSLVSFVIKEDWAYELSGVTVKNVTVRAFSDTKLITEQNDDILFTHQSISGPVIYKTSAYCAYEKFPVKLDLNLTGIEKQEFENELIKLLNENGKKYIANILNKFIPNALVEKLLDNIKINKELKACELNKKDRCKIIESCCNLNLTVTGKSKTGEIVTAGGITLKEIDPKTMGSKIIDNLYFCGEVIDVDGLCGGFNLQHCWSSGFIAGNALKQ